jgi:hypothetical protein
MPILTFLAQVEAALKTGQATEHSYRPAMQKLLETLLAPAKAINEPKQAAYGAPDFVVQDGETPLGHVEAKDIGIDLGKIIADSELANPRTSNGNQLKRYRAALPNLLFTNCLEWHWFVNGQPRLDAPVQIATWKTCFRSSRRSRCPRLTRRVTWRIGWRRRRTGCAM